MVIEFAVTLVVSFLTFASHNFVLRAITQAGRKFQMMTVMLVLGLTHAFQILMFATTIYVLVEIFEHGSIVSQNAEVSGFQNYIYFSATNYTSLGYGDFLASEGLRYLAAFEALTGLLVIGWSTAFAFWWMQRHWLNECEEI